MKYKITNITSNSKKTPSSLVCIYPAPKLNIFETTISASERVGALKNIHEKKTTAMVRIHDIGAHENTAFTPDGSLTRW
jgi:hypothetical protein